MYICTVCQGKCRSETQLCYRHSPGSKAKANARVNKYRRSDKGKQVVRQIHVKHSEKVKGQEIGKLFAPDIQPV